MAATKKDNLPVNVDESVDNGGTITYANEVVAIMAGVAASEVEGIAGMCTSGGLADIIGRNKHITRGVKVDVGTEEASVDLYVIMEYGKPIQKACSEAQENVRKNIESMTGLHVVRVDVHVQGVSFEKENRDAQRNLENVAVPFIAPTADSEEASAPQTADETNDEEPICEVAESSEIHTVEPEAADEAHDETEEPIEATDVCETCETNESCDTCETCEACEADETEESCDESGVCAANDACDMCKTPSSDESEDDCVEAEQENKNQTHQAEK